MNTYVKYIILLFLLTFLTNGFAQKTDNFVQYTVADGLPSNNVYQALQDKKGYMWFATEGGVAKFDGREFKNFTIKDGLPTNDIYQMVEDEVGRIWLHGFSNSVYYIEDDNIVHFDTDENQCFDEGDYNRLSHISKSENGIDLGFPYGGINVYRDKVSCYNSDDKKHIRKEIAKIIGKKAELLSIFVLQELIIVFDNDTIITFKREGSLISKLKLTKPLLKGVKARGADNYISKEFSLVLSEDKSKIFVLTLDTLNLESTLDLITIFGDSPSHVRYEKYHDFVQVQSNLGCFNLKWGIKETGNLIYDVFLTPDKFDTNQINRVFHDQIGNIWVLNNKLGVYFISRFDKVMYDIKSVASTPVQALVLANDMVIYGDDLGRINSLWSDQVEIYIDNNNNESIKSIKKIKYDSISNELIFLKNGQLPLFYNLATKKLSLLFDSQLGIESKTVLDKQYVIRGESRSLANHTLRVPDDFEILENEMFFALNDFVFRVERDQFNLDTILYIKSKIIKKKNDHLIVCNNNKLTFIDSLFNPLAEYEYECGIASIEEFQDGVLVLLENGKLHRANSNISSQWNYENFEPLSGTKIHVDDKIWIASSTGLYRYNYSKGNLNLDNFQIVKSINDFIINKDSIYFATDNGLLIRHINDIDSIYLEAPLYFTLTEQFGDFIVEENDQLDYNQNNIRFNYSLLDYGTFGDYKIHLKLISSDTVLINSSSNEFIFPNLEPNDYRLEFNVSDNFGRVSNQYGFKFKINEPWWGRSLFQALILIGFIVGGFIIYNISIKRIKEKEAQATLVNRKMAELRLTALQSQMNPHFIFNCLNSIQYLIQIEDSKSADDYLSQFSDLLRSFLENSMDKFVSIEKEIDLVLVYCDLEKLRFEKSYELYYSNTLSEEEQSMLIIPTNIIQPIVENAINHGLFHKVFKGELIISIERNGQFVKVLIQDNGIGRIASKMIKKEGAKSHKSLGLHILNEKLDVLRTVEGYSVELNYEDLYDGLNNAMGTRVTINFPINKMK